MKLIALDSSGLTASCAILEDDILRAEYTVPSPPVPVPLRVSASAPRPSRDWALRSASP